MFAALFFYPPYIAGLLLPSSKALGLFFILFLVFGIYAATSPMDDAGSAIGKSMFLLIAIGGCAGALIKGLTLWTKDKLQLSRMTKVLKVFMTLFPFWAMGYSVLYS